MNWVHILTLLYLTSALMARTTPASMKSFILTCTLEDFNCQSQSYFYTYRTFQQVVFAKEVREGHDMPIASLINILVSFCCKCQREK